MIVQQAKKFNLSEILNVVLYGLLSSFLELQPFFISYTTLVNQKNCKRKQSTLLSTQKSTKILREAKNIVSVILHYHILVKTGILEKSDESFNSELVEQDTKPQLNSPRLNVSQKKKQTISGRNFHSSSHTQKKKEYLKSHENVEEMYDKIDNHESYMQDRNLKSSKNLKSNENISTKSLFKQYFLEQIDKSSIRNE